MSKGKTVKRSKEQKEGDEIQDTFERKYNKELDLEEGKFIINSFLQIRYPL